MQLFPLANVTADTEAARRARTENATDTPVAAFGTVFDATDAGEQQNRQLASPEIASPLPDDNPDAPRGGGATDAPMDEVTVQTVPESRTTDEDQNSNLDVPKARVEAAATGTQNSDAPPLRRVTANAALVQGMSTLVPTHPTVSFAGGPVGDTALGAQHVTRTVSVADQLLGRSSGQSTNGLGGKGPVESEAASTPLITDPATHGQVSDQPSAPRSRGAATELLTLASLRNGIEASFPTPSQSQTGQADGAARAQARSTELGFAAMSVAETRSKDTASVASIAAPQVGGSQADTPLATQTAVIIRAVASTATGVAATGNAIATGPQSVANTVTQVSHGRFAGAESDLSRVDVGAPIAIKSADTTLATSGPKPIAMPGAQAQQLTPFVLHDQITILSSDTLESDLMWDIRPQQILTQTSVTPPKIDLPPQIPHTVVQGFRAASDRPVEIAMNPVELGRVRMLMTTAETGITLVITAERAETLDLMRRNIDDLAKSFAELGYDDIAFAFGQGDVGQHHADDGQDTTAESALTTTQDGRGDPVSPSAVRPSHVPLTDNGIDIRL